MALTFASYVAPVDGWVQRGIAIVAVVLSTTLNYRGVTKTARATLVLVVMSLLALAIVVLGVATGGNARVDNLHGWPDPTAAGVYGILQAAGLLFFAFAGYARIATLGEEVREPERAIPRAILIAFFVTLIVYFVVGISALLAAGPEVLAASSAPLATALDEAGSGWLQPVVRIGAATASFGALLTLMAGIGRTTLAMARNGDMPTRLSGVHPRHSTPYSAELALAFIVVVVVLLADLRGVIGFSSCGVLVYYAIANMSAFTQRGAERRCPRWVNVFGVIGCSILVMTLPGQSVLAASIMFAAGIFGRLFISRRRADRWYSA